MLYRTPSVYVYAHLEIKCKIMNPVFNDLFSFRNGSIIVDFWIRVTWPLTSGGLIEKIKEMLGQGGRIHQMQVDPGYFPHDTGKGIYRQAHIIFLHNIYTCIRKRNEREGIQC